MTLHEIAINAAKQSLQELAATDINTNYGGDIGAAARSLYESHLKDLKQGFNTDDAHLEVGTVVKSPKNQLVRFVNEDAISD